MIVLLGNHAVPRPDIDPAFGANFDLTADHVSEGSLTVKIPLAGVAPQECDRLRIAGLKMEADDAYYTVTANDLTTSWDAIADKLLTGAWGLHGWQAAAYNYDVMMGANGYDVTSTFPGTLVAGAKIYFPIIYFNGTIMSVKQSDEGNSPDLDYKIFELSVASAARCLSRVYCDMQFPQGATVTQILFGNHSGQTWYSSALGDFYGLVEFRVINEGFTSITNQSDPLAAPAYSDLFNDVTINAPANLWGSVVSDVLDDLATNAGAIWQIDEFDRFTFTRNANTGTAPFMLDTSAPAFDFNPTRDSYTTYSAVRVVGGKGTGAPTKGIARSSGQNNFKYNSLEIVDTTHANLQFPLSSYHQFVTGTVPYPGRMCLLIKAVAGSGGYNWYPVYYAGIETPPAGVPAATITAGSQGITAVNGLTFPTLPSTPPAPSTWNTAAYVEMGYVPTVPVVVRLVDPDLSDEIRTQAGGSGIIEYIYKDENLTDFGNAAQVATGLLDNISRRTIAVEFKTHVAGFNIGQTITGTLPYYGINGDNYSVTAVKAEMTGTNADGSVQWTYTVQASTAAYRDSIKGLFYVREPVTFKLGQDFPTTDGVFVDSEIGVRGNCWIYPCSPDTWTTFAAKNQTWNDIAAAGKSWDDLLNRASTTNFGQTGQLNSTQTARDYFKAILTGTRFPTSGELDFSHRIKLTASDATTLSLTHDLTDPGVMGESIFAVYQAPTASLQGHKWTLLEILNRSNETIASFTITMDATTSGIFNGKDAIIYTGFGLRPTQLTGRPMCFKVGRLTNLFNIIMANAAHGSRNWLYSPLYDDYLSVNSDNYTTEAFNTNKLMLMFDAENDNPFDIGAALVPLDGPNITGDTITTTYSLPPTVYGTFTGIAFGNPYLLGNISVKINKTVSSPLGQYSVTIVKREKVI